MAYAILPEMKRYQYLEHGIGYQKNGALRTWRPQFPVISSWVKSGSKVLDLGCGDGVLGGALIKEKGCQVTGIDLDLKGVKAANKRGVKAQVSDLDEGLKFKDNEFDLVINTEVLQFVKNPDLVVSETLRVGKVAIIAFPNFGFWFYRLQLLFGYFPTLALYGHKWWQTSQNRFFSYNDFLSLPSLKKAKLNRSYFIDWKNRKRSLLANISPNLFARSCIMEFRCP